MSRSFVGSGNYFDCTNPTPTNITGTQITLAAWIRPGADLTNLGIIQKWSPDNHYILVVDAGSKILAGFGGIIFATGATNVVSDQWQHIVALMNGTATFVYLNGVQDATNGSVTNMATTSSSVLLGSEIGLQAESAIWNIGLTPAEVLALSKGMSPLLLRPQNLKAYWPMHGSASPEKDYSGNGVHVVTVNGTVPAGDRNPPVMPFVLPSFASEPVGAPVGQYTDADTVYVDIQASGVDIGPYVDSAEVYVDIQASGIEEFSYSDIATAPITITPGGTEFKESIDSATVYYDIQPSGVDVFGAAQPCFQGDGIPEARWDAFEADARWSGDADVRFNGNLEIGAVTC